MPTEEEDSFASINSSFFNKSLQLAWNFTLEVLYLFKNSLQEKTIISLEDLGRLDSQYIFWQNTFSPWEWIKPISGFSSLQLKANDIIVGIGTIGKLWEKAKPLAKLNPILSPVKDPGPLLTAIALTSDSLNPISFCISWKKRGSFSTCFLALSSSIVLIPVSYTHLTLPTKA